MKLVCPSCAASYDVRAALIPREGRMVRCRKCSAEWWHIPQTPPSEALPPKPSTPPRRAPPVAGQQNGGASGRRERERPEKETNETKETKGERKAGKPPPPKAAGTEARRPSGEAAQDSPPSIAVAQFAAGTEPPPEPHHAAHLRRRESYALWFFLAASAFLLMVAAIRYREALTRAFFPEENPGQETVAHGASDPASAPPSDSPPVPPPPPVAAEGPPDPGAPADFAVIEATYDFEEGERGARSLLISGEIINQGEAPARAPDIIIIVRDTAERELFRWKTTALPDVIEPGETGRYVSRLAYPPEGIANVIIDLARP